MSSLLEELQALHAIDQKLIHLKKRLQAGPKEIVHYEKKLAELAADRKAAEEEIKRKASGVDQCNLDIRTAEAELQKAEEQLRGTKNNKEYKILTDQIKEYKNEISEKETQALQIMEELDGLRGAIKEKQAQEAAAREKLEAIKAEIAEEEETIRAEGKTLKQERNGQIARIRALDREAQAVYDDALQRGRGSALAEMNAGGVCQACFRKASPNIENIVLVGKDLKEMRCAGCGRILFAARNQPVE
jgi:predicted  nucleic acid-binding Zn-ribbon protein